MDSTNYLLKDDHAAKTMLLPATDEEIAAAIESFGGFPNSDFKRVGANVFVIDGSIAVVLKFEPNKVTTLYLVDEDGLSEAYGYDHIRNKVWASEEVIDQIRQAYENK